MKGHNWELCRKCGKDHGPHRMKGRHLSDETKQKMRLKRIGRHLSEVTKRKIGDANRGKPSPLKGKTYEEISGKGRKGWNKGLTKETDKRVARNGVKIREGFKRFLDENPEYFEKLKIIRREWLKSHTPWDKGLTEESDPRVAKRSENERTYFKNLTEEEKEIRLKKTLFKCNAHPNKSEEKLIPILEPFGFLYNKSHKFISGYVPDFVHSFLLLIIEFDGWAGHNSSSPNNRGIDVEARDRKRNQAYELAGYKLLILKDEDLKDLVRTKEKVVNWIGNGAIIQCSVLQNGVRTLIG